MVRIHGNQTEKEWTCLVWESSKIIGHGRQHNSDHPRRFEHADCGKTFNGNMGTILHHNKVPENTIITVIYLFLIGYPVRHILLNPRITT